MYIKSNKYESYFTYCSEVSVLSGRYGRVLCCIAYFSCEYLISNFVRLCDANPVPVCVWKAMHSMPHILRLSAYGTLIASVKIAESKRNVLLTKLSVRGRLAAQVVYYYG
jgi:hypothetical protein